MEFSEKIVDSIAPLTIFAKKIHHVWLGPKYASDYYSCTCYVQLNLNNKFVNTKLFRVEPKINPLSTSVALIEKPVNWFAQQINWLVPVWEQHWHLMGLNILRDDIEPLQIVSKFHSQY